MVSFGDFFLVKGKIYRTFSNSDTSGMVKAIAMYLKKGNKLTKIPKQKFVWKEVALTKIEKIFSPQIKEGLSFEIDYIIKKLKKGGIDNFGLTGSRLLRSYGFEINPIGGDIDIVIYDESSSNRLLSNVSKLYDKTFLSYEKNIASLFQRRVSRSNVETDQEYIKSIESKKTIGVINNIHVNITPSYKKDQDFLESLERDYSGSKIVIVNLIIKGIDNSGRVPGFYIVQGKYNNYSIKYLKSNYFYIMLGQKNILNRKVKIKGVLKNLGSSKKDCLLDVDSSELMGKISIEILRN